MKKLLAMLGVAVGAGSVFAEGSNPTYSIDTTAVTTALPKIQEQLSGYLTDILPWLLSIAAVFMALWLARLVIGGIKSFGSSAAS